MSARRMRSSRRGRVAPRPRVEVRESRHGRELVVDGTFASFYTPGSAVTGSVWDAIAAPVLALPPERRRSALVLGLGGGSATRVLRAVAPRCRIVGVERDPEVIRLARRHFDLDGLRIELVRGDALEFLRSDRGRYDVVLEDVFVGSGDSVHKPDWIPEPGHGLAARRLRPGGLLVSNTLDEASAVARALCARFAQVVRIDVEDFDNRILAASGTGASGAAQRPRACQLDAAGLRAAVAASPVLAPTLPRLRFRTLSGRRRGSAGSAG